jgi:predicted RNA binding protein YcfA (HicA-like mRNA interferase family)
MPRLPRLNSQKILSALSRAGFYIHHQTGSHINLRHEFKTHLHVVIPRRHKDLAPKTLKSIIIQAELSIEDFNGLL